jgi:hypothetical protein
MRRGYLHVTKIAGFPVTDGDRPRALLRASRVTLLTSAELAGSGFTKAPFRRRNGR